MKINPGWHLAGWLISIYVRTSFALAASARGVNNVVGFITGGDIGVGFLMRLFILGEIDHASTLSKRSSSFSESHTKQHDTSRSNVLISTTRTLPACTRVVAVVSALWATARHHVWLLLLFRDRNIIVTILVLLLVHARGRGEKREMREEMKNGLQWKIWGKAAGGWGSGCCFQSKESWGSSVFKKSVLAKRGLFLFTKRKEKLWCSASVGVDSRVLCFYQLAKKI